MVSIGWNHDRLSNGNTVGIGNLGIRRNEALKAYAISVRNGIQGIAAVYCAAGSTVWDYKRLSH